MYLFKFSFLVLLKNLRSLDQPIGRQVLDRKTCPGSSGKDLIEITDK